MANKRIILDLHEDRARLVEQIDAYLLTKDKHPESNLVGISFEGERDYSVLRTENTIRVRISQ